MRSLRPALLLAAAVTLAACATDPTSLAPDAGRSPRGPSLALAAGNNTDVVTESDIARQPENTPPTRNWVLYSRNAGTAAFRTGPASPPRGSGSIEFTTPTGSDKAFLFNYDLIGTRLADVDAMAYATYRTAGNDQQVTALNMEIDFNGPDQAGGFSTLVFEPVYNTSQGAVASGQWQTWDAYAGGQAIWWSTRAIPGVCAFSCYVTWADIVAANPNATVLGGFGLNQGSGNPGLVAAVDYLTFGAAGNRITWNFEQYEVPTTAAACRDGGYRTVTRADGSGFKNQGDCIQYVNTGK